MKSTPYADKNRSLVMSRHRCTAWLALPFASGKMRSLLGAMLLAACALPAAHAQAVRATQAVRWMIPTPPADGSYYNYDPTTYIVITNVGARPAHVTTRFYNRGAMVGPYSVWDAGVRRAEERVGVLVPPGGTATFRDKASWSEFQVVLSDEPVIVTAWVLRSPYQPGGGAFVLTDALALDCSGPAAAALACNAPMSAMAPPAIAPGEPR
jgi:hypothetical protein